MMVEVRVLIEVGFLDVDYDMEEGNERIKYCRGMF